MNITYNGLSSPTKLVCFTDIPNILKVNDYSDGTKAVYNLVVVGDFYGQTTSDNQWYITLFGDTITNVLDPSNAVNKAFHVSTANTSTAFSIARALRNCPNLAANFTVRHSGFTVTVEAREVGSVFNGNYFSTNIASAYLGRGGTDGYAESDLQGALIDVDVYSNDNYITTLEKNWYNGEAAFDMSPVLTTLSEYGRIVPYEFKVSSFKDGEYALLGSVSDNYTTVGYMCNQGYKYIAMNSIDIAANLTRGENKGVDNNTILYLYQPSIDISIYTGNEGGFNYQIDYLDSAYNTIHTVTSMTQCQSYSLKDLHYELNHSGSAYFPLAFYVDLTIGHRKIRYNVIKPLKATEYSQRILWRNEYGGLSFVDLTGARSESHTSEVSTYQKNIFGYYDDTKNELNKIYDNKVEYKVTLKSHLMEKDGIWLYNSLLQSSEVWTEVNGETYGIIIDSVSVEEQNQNDIYQATVQYHYSQEPSLL